MATSRLSPVRFFVDTSAWFALINARDRDHATVAETVRGVDGRLVTSNYVFDEIVTLCRTRLGHDVATQVGFALLDIDTTDLIRISADDERNAWRRFMAREDQVYSFTDCTSFALIDRLRVGQVIALDDDFRREGYVTLP